MTCHRCGKPYRTPGIVDGGYLCHEGQCMCWNSETSREHITETCACGVVALPGVHTCAQASPAPPPTCASCAHWDTPTPETVARAGCGLLQIDYPWSFNSCTRWTDRAAPKPPEPPPHFDMRAAWGQYVPGVKP